MGEMGEPLTDEQIAEEEKFLAGLPRVNLGALFLAPVWGPAHGMWAAFLFFVAWLFADNVIYAATVEPTAMNVVLAVLMAAGLVAATVVFAIVAQPFAAHRAENMGVSRETYLRRERIWAVFFVGNRLLLDDGVGPAAYDEILAAYDIPESVTLVDVGCMSLDMLPYVERCDVILTVDAVDGTGDAPGTVYRFEPDAMARHSGPEASLHDLKLVDLFDAASLMGYEAEGFCLGMQVGNPSPEQFVVGLTPECAAALPLLVETVVAELHRRGFPLQKK